MRGTGTITRRGLATGLAALAACRPRSGAKLPQETRDFLLTATTFAIVAVHPAMATPTAKPEGVTELLWAHGVLGRADVEAAVERSEIVDLIDEAVGDGDSSTTAGCFNPRHAVSATRDDRRIDILICFECASLEVHDGAAKPVSHQIGSSPESRMSELFRKRGLTLAPTRK